jgi:hypothetical protein
MRLGQGLQPSCIWVKDNLQFFGFCALRIRQVMSQNVATFGLFLPEIPLAFAHLLWEMTVVQSELEPIGLITFQEAGMYSTRALGVGLAIFLAFTSVAFAQGTADIVGRVTDTSGGVLPAVTVTATNVATKTTRSTISSETGDYTFTLLPIGSYTLKIELQGFQTVNARVDLSTGDRSRVDARMTLGTVEESVMVTGEAPLLQTDSSTVSSLINEKTVQDSPIPGRNIIRMVQLIPGASEGALSSLANGTRPDERRQTSSVSINGVNDVLNNQLVDGMDNNHQALD